MVPYWTSNRNRLLNIGNISPKEYLKALKVVPNYTAMRDEMVRLDDLWDNEEADGLQGNRVQ